MNKQALLFGLVGVVAAGMLFFFFTQEKTDISQSDKDLVSSDNADTTDSNSQEEANEEVMGEKQMNQPPEMQIDQSKSYTANIKTSEGDIAVELNADQTPITVNNFVSLSRDGFYDGTVFHRVLEGFMIQGGDPEGTGAGGPGYQFDDEPFEGEYTRGTLAMANAGPNTNGSQFFIMHDDVDLPKNYVIFGKVASGLDVVDRIATAEVTTSFGGEKSKPVDPVEITTVEIVEE